MHFIWAKSNQIHESEKGKESCNMLTEDCTRVFGLRMSDMDKDMSDTLVGTSIEVNFRMEKLMEEVSMNGETERFMMETGLQE